MTLIKKNQIETYNKSDVGLGNVDNTSDATKNAATATLTNKTIDLSNNTITGTTSEFNAALSDGSFATGGGTATGTNTGDQTSIVGISGTKAQFDTAVTDGDIVYVGDNITGKSASTDALNSATTTVNVSSATAPTVGQVLTATSGTAATWQTPAGGGGGNGPIISGTISGTQITGDVLEIPVSKTITAAEFRISLKTKPTGGDFICKLFKNGVEDAAATIATTATATNGLFQATDTTFVSGSYVAGDVLKVEITQVGSSVAGSDFTFSLVE